MVYPSDWADDDDAPSVELPAGPRPPSIVLVALLAVSGVTLLLAPFVYAAFVPREPLHETPAAMVAADVSRSDAETSLATFSATAGPGCPNARAASYHRVGNFFKGQVGWLHFGSGCVGRTDSLPLSGDARTPNPTLYAEWDFHTDPVVRGSCLIQVYIPDVDDIVFNGGEPAHYLVYSTIQGGDPGRPFAVAQPRNRGSWVTLGIAPIVHGELRIVLTNQGENMIGSVPTYRHVSASAVKVTCS